MEKISTKNSSYDGFSNYNEEVEEEASNYNDEADEEEEDTVYNDEEWDLMSESDLFMDKYSDFDDDEKESSQTLPHATPNSDKPMHKYPFKLQQNETG